MQDIYWILRELTGLQYWNINLVLSSIKYINNDALGVSILVLSNLIGDSIRQPAATIRPVQLSAYRFTLTLPTSANYKFLPAYISLLLQCVGVLFIYYFLSFMRI